MATAGLTCVVRQSLGKLVHRSRICLQPKKYQRHSVTVISQTVFCPCSYYGTTTQSDVTVVYRDGLPVITVPLPSRKERCEFTLKPISHTVGDLLYYLQEEDGGIDRAAVYSEDGSKIARSTTLDILLRSNFQLVLNDDKYDVTPPQVFSVPSEDAQTLSDVKGLIGKLYSQLNVEQHQLEKEREALQLLEDLKMELAPLEQSKMELERSTNQRMKYMSWLGLGLMGVQFGLLARLTWWEYSWDIMEPVTYFITYGTTMAMYAYFVLTRQEYNFADVKDRQFLLTFHKGAKKQKLDVERYNELKIAIAAAEKDLKRLRDPLQLHLPIQELQE